MHFIIQRAPHITYALGPPLDKTGPGLYNIVSRQEKYEFLFSQLNKGLFKYDLTPKGGEESDGKVISLFLLP